VEAQPFVPKSSRHGFSLNPGSKAVAGEKDLAEINSAPHGLMGMFFQFSRSRKPPVMWQRKANSQEFLPDS